jgi:2-dehydro-3-deoxyglucarate aldolase/4-hydroxy-2-oxoheptanedioate aldolase
MARMTAGPHPTIRARIRSRSPLVGTFLNLGSPLAAEACALAGFDWLLVDLEHGGRGEDGLLGQLLAGAAHDVPVLVRVESDSRIRAGRVLDAGAAGVMFPRIESVEDAVAAVRHMRYPPEGDRGVATYNRSIGFGLAPEVLERSGSLVVGVLQIETLGALDSVAEISRVPGVDVLFVGPRDLSQALGIPGRMDHPAFRDALARVSRAAEAAGIAAGILAGTAEAAARYVDDGFTFVGVGSDSTTLASAGRQTVTSFRAAVAPARMAGENP